MELILTALTVVAILFAGSASAFDPDNLRALTDNYECKSCGLSGAKLKGAILCNTTMPDGSVIYSGF